MNDFERQVYEVSTVWASGHFTNEEHARYEATAELVDQASRTVIDIGCGSGEFLRCLHKRAGAAVAARAYVGVDRSNTALAHLKRPIQSIAASVDQIPLPDSSFDTVTCLQVIEHLPLKVYEKCLAELCRLSREQIIISVPYAQNLGGMQVRCPSCSCKFNADYHLHSYRHDSMKKLLIMHGFECEEVKTFGKDFHHNRLRRVLKSMILESPFPATTICPMCGYEEPEKRVDTLASRRSGSSQGVRDPSTFRVLIRDFIPGKAKWIIASYRKREGCL